MHQPVRRGHRWAWLVAAALTFGACTAGTDGTSDPAGAGASPSASPAAPASDDTTGAPEPSPSLPPSATPAPSRVVDGPGGVPVLGDARVLGDGRPVAAAPGDRAVYVLAPDPDSDRIGCEGPEADRLWHVAIADGARTPAFAPDTGDEPALTRLVPGTESRYLAVESCEGELVRLLVAGARDDGRLTVLDDLTDAVPGFGSPASARWGRDGQSVTIVSSGTSDQPAAYRIGLDGRRPTELLSLPSLGDYVELSDGTALAIDGGELVPVDESGAVDGPLRAADQLAVSPNERHVALSTFGEPDSLVVLDRNDGTVTALPDQDVFSMGWSADGSVLHYTTGGSGGGTWLVLTDAEGARRTELPDGGFDPAVFAGGQLLHGRLTAAAANRFEPPELVTRPVLSVPAGDRLGAPQTVAEGRLEAVSRDGTALVIQREDPSRDGCEGGPASELVRHALPSGPSEALTTPDGTPLAGGLLRGGADNRVLVVHGCEGFLSRLWSATEQADGRLAELRELPKPEAVVDWWALRWAPDGRTATVPRSGFTAGDPADAGLYRMTLEDGSLTQLAAATDIVDGRELADGTLLLSLDDDGAGGAARVELRGADGVRIGVFDGYDSWAVSPSGADVLLTAVQGGVARVQRGYDLELVASLPAFNPRWLPDGSGVTFLSSAVDGDQYLTEAWLLRPEPARLVKLTASAGFSPAIGAPGGAAVAYTELLTNDGFGRPEVRVRTLDPGR